MSRAGCKKAKSRSFSRGGGRLTPKFDHDRCLSSGTVGPKKPGFFEEAGLLNRNLYRVRCLLCLDSISIS